MQEDNLFSHLAEEERKKRAPLADRMRPRRLDDILGQGHLFDKGRL